MNALEQGLSLVDLGIIVGDRVIFLDNIKCEPPVRFGSDVVLEDQSSIGLFSYINDRSAGCLVDIGRYCSIGPDVALGLGVHPTDRLTTHPIAFDNLTPYRQFSYYRDVGAERDLPPMASVSTVIGNDVWIGRGAMIMKGLKVGDGAIIAAGAVVTRNVKSYEIVAGVPAKHLRFRFDPKTVERLEAIQFWKYDLRGLNQKLPFADVQSCLAILERGLKDGSLHEMHAPKIAVRGIPGQYHANSHIA
jgi:acetyltransferase-like isoleucine patch superfamily enzyme